MYRPARSEKVIGMTILGARVVLVLRAQAAYPGPANTHSPPTRYPAYPADHRSHQDPSRCALSWPNSGQMLLTGIIAGGDAQGKLALFFVRYPHIDVADQLAHDLGGLLAVVSQLSAVVVIT